MASLLPKRCIVLSCAPWQQDSRVRRTIEALSDAGVQVVAITPRASADAPDRPEVRPIENRSTAPEGWTTRRKVTSVLAFLSARGIPTEHHARRVAGAMPYVTALSAAVNEHLATLANPRDVVLLANDWHALPAAIAAQERFGCAFHYDTHELAVSEHASNALWRIAYPPAIAQLEQAAIRRGATVSCVSPGIARSMAERYAMTAAPLVVRNIPSVTSMSPRPVGTPITVLYHGLFKADRGLLELIESATAWPDRFRLVLRGHAPNSVFGAHLAQRARSLGHRVSIEPMVAPDHVVEAANTADIGIFLPDLASPQNRYALPNKLFEYLAAGLMMIAPAATDMADVIEAHGVGIALDDVSPAALAQRLVSLSNEDIAAFKQRAHLASRALQSTNDYPALLKTLGITSRAEV